MKYERITKPHAVGCMTCSNVPRYKLNKKETRFADCALVLLKVDGCVIADDSEFEGLSLSQVEEKYALKLSQARESVLLETWDWLHSEKYEQDADGEWYLVTQDTGIA